MRNVLRVLLILGLISLSSLSRADLMGSSVNGVLSFGGWGDNWFDPAQPFNTGIPAGYGNYAGLPVTVGSGVEFGYSSSEFITVDFTGTQLLVTMLINADTSGCAPGCYFNSVWMQFDDAMFTQLTKISDTFPLGGMNGYYIDSDTIQLVWAGETASGGGHVHYGDYYTATFDVAAPGAVPEPSSLLLMGTGLIALAGAVRRKVRW